MEPIDTERTVPKAQFPASFGFTDDGRKVPLRLFLHVNAGLTDFQRQVIPMFMGVFPTEEDLSQAMAHITRQINLLHSANWKPKKQEGDMVLRPKHYDMPIEPTFFNRENRITWNLGNALKYICRFPQKNGIEDLQKALRYIAMELRFRRGEEGWSN